MTDYRASYLTMRTAAGLPRHYRGAIRDAAGAIVWECPHGYTHNQLEARRCGRHRLKFSVGGELKGAANVCARCGRLFVARSSQRRYCSGSCRQLAYLERKAARSEPERENNSIWPNPW